MKEIRLTQGKVALVDDEDFERINLNKWCAHKDGKSGKFYAVRNAKMIRPLRKTIYMAREVINAPDGIGVDHIHFDDTLDNRKSNLRLATSAQNGWNRGKPANNTSGFKGVSWFAQTRRWQAKIKLNGKSIGLGYFDSAESAARAYDESARKYYGEFAVTNF